MFSFITESRYNETQPKLCFGFILSHVNIDRFEKGEFIKTIILYFEMT